MSSLPARGFALAVLVGWLLAACAPASVQLLGTPPAAPTAASASATPAEPIATETAGGPTPTSLPDYTGEQITLLHLCARSGPFGVANAGYARAVEERIAAINAAGGVLGAELALAFGDTAGGAEDAQAALQRLLRQHPGAALALVCDPASEGALAEPLAEAGLPALGPGVFEAGSLYPLEPAPEAQLEFAIGALLADWPRLRPSGTDAELRLAALAWPAEVAGDFGEALPDATQPAPQATPEAGTPIAPIEPYARLVLQLELPAEPLANIHEFIYQARDANANVIYTNMRGVGLAALLNALHDLGVRERFVVVAPALSYDLQLYEYLADPARAQGLYLTSAWAWWGEADNPGVQALLAAGAAGDFPDWGALRGAGAVDIARHALQQTLLDVGYERLNAATAARALRGLRGYAVLDGLAVFGLAAGSPAAELRLWQVSGELGELQLALPAGE